MFTDGCCFRDDKGKLQAGCSVVRQVGDELEVLKAKELEGTPSSQLAELEGLKRELEMHDGQEVTIYSDSAYTVDVVHV